MNELIGIVVPVYNVEDYLEKCIESLIHQTYQNLEIILINDGSKDSSYEIIKKYKNQDDRIIGIDRENKGSIYTRLEGARITKAKYIMFVDSDDWLDKDTIEKSYIALKKYNADLVKFNMVKEFTKENRKRYIRGPYEKEKCISKELLEKEFYPIVLNSYYCNSLCAQLIKKELIENIEVPSYQIRMGDDLLCNLDIIKKVNTVVCLNEFFYHYRHTENSLTTLQDDNRIKTNITDTYVVYNKLFEMLKAWNIDTEKNRLLVKKRILREMFNILLPVFVSREKTEKKKEYCSFSREKIDDSKINVSMEKLKLEEKLFMKKNYSALIRYTNIKYKIPHEVKTRIKKLLKLWNRRRKI